MTISVQTPEKPQGDLLVVQDDVEQLVNKFANSIAQLVTNTK